LFRALFAPRRPAFSPRRRRLYPELLEERTVPSITYGFAIGLGPGTGGDEGLAIGTDAAGDSYVAGWYTGTVDFDPSPTAALPFTTVGAQGGDGTDHDLFVAKYDPAGALLWAHSFGSAGADIARALAVDQAGNVVVTGSFMGTIDFDPDPGHVANLQATSGFGNIFVLKLDAGGNFVWADALTGVRGTGFANGVAVDDAGNAYVTGSFEGTIDFDPGTGVAERTPTAPSGEEVFVCKLDAGGNFAWVDTWEASHANGIAVGGGSVLVTGDFAGTVDFDPGTGVSNITSASGSVNVFVSKLDEAGNFVWARAMGGATGPAPETGRAVAVDAAGNVLTTGYFTSPADFGPFHLDGGGDGRQPVFVSRLDAAGNFVWARQLTTDADGAGIAVDAAGSVYVTGQTDGSDIFLARFGADGRPLGESTVGNTGADAGRAVAVDAGGGIYLTGTYTGLVDFDPGTGVHNLGPATDVQDIFVAKYTQPGDTLQFGTATVTAAEDAGVATFTVTRTGDGVGQVSATVRVVGGTATAGVDYQADPQTVVFPDGDTAPRTVTVRLLDNALPDGDRTVQLALTDPTTGAVLGSPASATLVIRDNDALPGSSPSPQPSPTPAAAAPAVRFELPVCRVKRGWRAVRITVLLAAASSQPLTFGYMVVREGRGKGNPFLPVSGTLTLAPGETRKSLALPLKGRSPARGRARLILADAGGAVLAVAQLLRVG
jgi:hypothetical protein